MKVAGTLSCVSGAILMVVFKGPVILGHIEEMGLHSEIIAKGQPEPVGWFLARTMEYGFDTFHLGVLCLIGNCMCMDTYLAIQEKEKGKRPTASELFLDTHFKQAPGKEPQPVSSKAKEVMEKYTQNLSESQASGSPSDPNEVFFDTVGGYRKGEVLGFGKHGASLYYEKRPRRHGDSGYYSPSVSAKLTQMTEELERTKAELAETNRERAEEHRRMVEKQAQQDAKQAQQDAYIQQMKEQMDMLMRRFGDQPPGPGRFPDDRTDGSGGSGSFPVVS